MFDKWRDGRGYREIARDLGCSAGNLTLWKQGRVPLNAYLEKLEQIADVPPIAWKHWICVDPSKGMEFDPDAPISIEKIAAAEDWARQHPEDWLPWMRDYTDFARALLAARPLYLADDDSGEDTEGLRLVDALLKRVNGYLHSVLFDRRIVLGRLARTKSAA